MNFEEERKAREEANKAHKIYVGTGLRCGKNLFDAGEFINTGLTYAYDDINETKNFFNYFHYENPRPIVEKVIFNGPATIVLWTDGTKTVVKCAEEDYITNDLGETEKVIRFDKEKGLAMAIAKKFLGTNKSGSNYYDVFKKWIFEEPETVTDVPEVISDVVHAMAKVFRTSKKAKNNKGDA